MGRAGENATITKIRAIHGKMLTQEDYNALSSKRTVAEVAQYLKEHRRFRSAFADIDVNTVHRDYLEELLRKNKFELFVKLRDFQHLKHIHFYNSTCERYELEQLLSLISSIDDGERKSFVSSLPGYFLSEANLDFLELSKCASVQDICDKLKATKYSALTDSIDKYASGTIDHLGLEIRFRTFFYKRLMKCIDDELPKSDAKLLTDAVRRDVDVRNTVNAYRMKEYFNLNADELRERRLPFSKMSSAKLERLYESEDSKDILELLGSEVSGTVNDESAEFIETIMERIRLKRAKKLLREQSLPAVYYAFLELCDIETDNITHIIEGIRYGLKPDRIEQLIVY